MILLEGAAVFGAWVLIAHAELISILKAYSWAKASDVKYRGYLTTMVFVAVPIPTPIGLAASR